MVIGFQWESYMVDSTQLKTYCTRPSFWFQPQKKWKRCSYFWYPSTSWEDTLPPQKCTLSFFPSSGSLDPYRAIPICAEKHIPPRSKSSKLSLQVHLKLPWIHIMRLRPVRIWKDTSESTEDDDLMVEEKKHLWKTPTFFWRLVWEDDLIFLVNCGDFWDFHVHFRSCILMEF